MFKKILSALIAMVSLVACSACTLPFLNTQESVSVSHTEEIKIAGIEKKTAEMLAIRVLEDTDVKLLSVMQDLQADGLLTFTKDMQGMITSINGQENAADWSACWMLYTSDTELSSTAWGGYEYNGNTLGSASFGASDMPVKKGEVYVWAYVAF